MSRKIARITADKKLLLSNEIIEGDKISLNADGTLYVNEIIEDDKFSINSNGIEVTELIEDCSFDDEEFLLDFVVQYDDTGAVFYTNTVTVPKDCVLYMDVNGTENVDFDWIVNGETIRGWAGSGLTAEWLNRTISVKKGDTLSITGVGILETELRDTMVLRLDDANGAKVAEFDFVLEPLSCYLTTAMVGYFNKADDGIELTAMRELRSHSGYKYQDVLEEYAQMSPIIIRGIEQSEDKDYYYNMIKDVVDNIVIWVADEEWERAETAYLDLYYYLKEKFGGD